MERRTRREVIRTINRLFSASVGGATHGTSSDDEYDSPSVDHASSANEKISACLVVEKHSGEPFDCPITLCSIEEGAEIARLEVCSHRFNRPAIEKWLRDHSPNCPVCRAYAFKEEEPEGENLILQQIEEAVRAAEEHLLHPDALGSWENDLD